MVRFDFDILRFHLTRVVASKRKASILRCTSRVNLGNSFSVLWAVRVVMMMMPWLRIPCWHGYTGRLETISCWAIAPLAEVKGHGGQGIVSGIRRVTYVWMMMMAAIFVVMVMEVCCTIGFRSRNGRDSRQKKGQSRKTSGNLHFGLYLSGVLSRRECSVKEGDSTQKGNVCLVVRKELNLPAIQKKKRKEKE